MLTVIYNTSIYLLQFILITCIILVHTSNTRDDALQCETRWSNAASLELSTYEKDLY